MFELQLIKIQQQMPQLLQIIDSTIQGVYRRNEETTRDMRSDPLVGKRTGYLLHGVMEHYVRRAIEEAGIENVEVKAIKNGTSAYHLEIFTPYAVIMISHVHRSGDVPKKANFRQKFVDQTFIQEVYPELALFSSDCIPLYVVTHAQNRDNISEATIRIGRLSVDQGSWSCNYLLQDLIKNAVTTEEISSQSKVSAIEDVRRISNIRLKNS